MYDYDLKILEKKLIRLIEKGKFINKEIYLFGVSDNTRQICQILRKYHLEPEKVIDNDIEKQNSYCARLEVVALNKVIKKDNNKKIFIIYSGYWREMFEQLRHNNINKRNIYVLCRKKENLWKHLYQAIKGKEIYEKLIERYGKVPIFVCPYTGTGDIYLIGTFWNIYIKENKIKDYIFIVLTNTCQKVAQLFEIKNIELLTNKIECVYLIRYYMLCTNNVQLKLLNDGWGQIHANPMEWFRGYNGLDFMVLFRKYVFNLSETIVPKHPNVKNMDKELKEIFKKYKIQENNTIILSPYSNTLADLPNKFWEMLARKLKKMGYKVCTNSNGINESGIQGTIPIFFPLDISKQFIDKAGFFIGIRSGFCDVISNSKAIKIVIYDEKNRFYNTSAYDYFSLKKMGLSKDVIELFYKGNSEELVEQIIQKLRR